MRRSNFCGIYADIFIYFCIGFLFICVSKNNVHTATSHKPPATKQKQERERLQCGDSQQFN